MKPEVISELVVNVEPQEMSIAVLEDKNLVELQKEARNLQFAVGDIYLGKVKKLMPGLNAAFIDSLSRFRIELQHAAEVFETGLV